MKLETNVISIGQLINQIEKQTDYLVVFRNREVDTERKIHVQEKSGKVISYLKDAFDGTDISYEFTNKYILLSKKISRILSTKPSSQPERLQVRLKTIMENL